MGRATRHAALAASLTGLLTAAAAAQPYREPPRHRHGGRTQALPLRQAAPPARVGFGADNDAQPGGVPGNAPFNNQLRKFTDPLGANGGR